MEEIIEQIKWERDVAIEQLKELGYGLGEKIRTDEDCVSRKAVLDLVVTNHTELNGVRVVMYSPLCKDIKQLPPVTPNTKTDVLDKIRAEIQEYADNKAEPTEMRAYYHCLNIIDKYKAESEDRE